MLCGVVRGFCRDKEWCHWQGFVTRSGEDQKSREIARALIKECCPDHTNTIVSDTHDNKSLARRIGRVSLVVVNNWSYIRPATALPAGSLRSWLRESMYFVSCLASPSRSQAWIGPDKAGKQASVHLPIP